MRTKREAFRNTPYPHISFRRRYRAEWRSNPRSLQLQVCCSPILSSSPRRCLYINRRRERCFRRGKVLADRATAYVKIAEFYIFVVQRQCGSGNVLHCIAEKAVVFAKNWNLLNKKLSFTSVKITTKVLSPAKIYEKSKQGVHPACNPRPQDGEKR